MLVYFDGKFIDIKMLNFIFIFIYYRLHNVPKTITNTYSRVSVLHRVCTVT